MPCRIDGMDGNKRIVDGRSPRSDGLPASHEEPSPVERTWFFRHFHNVELRGTDVSLQKHCNQLHHPDSRPAALHRCANSPRRPHRELNYILQVVFWKIGGTNPSHSLRILLIRAGIETNPGPPIKAVSRPPCEACGTKIKGNASRFQCTMRECDKACHIKPECSLINRAAQLKTKWYCADHRSPASPDRHTPIQRRLQAFPPTSYVYAASSN